jgi:hypothetical protein
MEYYDEQLVKRLLNLPPRVRFIEFLAQRYGYQEDGGERVKIG